PAVTADGLAFAGPSDGVTLHPAAPGSADFLPQTAFPVVAPVRIDHPQEWGGILGCLQDNGPTKRGFVLGFNRTNFVFGLATQGGHGRLTYLAGRTAYRP